MGCKRGMPLRENIAFDTIHSFDVCSECCDAIHIGVVQALPSLNEMTFILFPTFNPL